MKYPLYQSATSPTRGRHLISTTQIPQNTLIFVERPLLALQSLPNAQTTLTCQNCHSFLGNSRIVLPLLSGRVNRCDFRHDGDETTTTTDCSSSTIIPCRHNCGMLFCSSSCHDDYTVNHGHDLICTGHLPEPNNEKGDEQELHPLIEFKMHAVRSNEIFLLVCHVITTVISQKRRHWESTWEEIMDPYVVFISLPWWEQVYQSYSDEEGGVGESDEKVLVSESCKRLCYESAELLRKALRCYRVNNDDDRGDDDDVRGIIEECCERYVTGEFFGRLIGSFEMNAIGIRAMHPVGDELVNDRWERDEIVEDFIEDLGRCIDLGYNDEEEEDDDDDYDGEEKTSSSDIDDDNEDKDEEECADYCCTIITPNDSTPCKLYTPTTIRTILSQSTPTLLTSIFPPLDGTGMYTTACQMNHSCRPNVQVRYIAGYGMTKPLMLQCVSLRDIECGEELCISYVDLEMELGERRRDLRNYCFECDCVRCRDEEDEGGDGRIDEEEDDDDDVNVLFDSDDDNDENDNNVGDAKENTTPNEEDTYKFISNSDTSSLPLTLYASLASFILQQANELLLQLNQNPLCHINSMDVSTCITIVQNRDFIGCIHYGYRISDEAIGTILKKGGGGNDDDHDDSSLSLWKRYHNVGCLTAILGQIQRGFFIDALILLDRVSILGLLSHEIIQDCQRYLRYFCQGFMSLYPPMLNKMPMYDKGYDYVERRRLALTTSLAFPIHEVENVSGVDFEAYVRNATPFLIRNFASDWPALREWCDVNTLCQQHGHRIIPIEIGNINLTSRQNQMRESLLPFQEFITKYLIPSYQTDNIIESTNSNNNNNTPHRPPPNDIAYLAQHPLFDQIPELESHIPTSQAITSLLNKNNNRSIQHVNIWMGTRHTRTPLHYDSYDNLFIQTIGIKYVRLYARDETDKLYVSSSNSNDRCYYGKQRNMSEVDCEHEDWERHPRAKEAKFLEGYVFPGDCLFIPEGVWHYVRSVTTSASVNYWW